MYTMYRFFGHCWHTDCRGPLLVGRSGNICFVHAKIDATKVRARQRIEVSMEGPQPVLVTAP